jgi:hypothetical protein
MRRVALLTAGLALIIGGFLAARGGNSANTPTSDKGRPVTIVLSGTLPLIAEKRTP